MAACDERVGESGGKVIDVHVCRKSCTRGCCKSHSIHPSSLSGTVHMMGRVDMEGGIVGVKINHHGSHWDGTGGTVCRLGCGRWSMFRGAMVSMSTATYLSICVKFLCG